MAGGIEGEGRHREPTPHQPRQPEQPQQLQEGNGAPGIPQTLNERAKPPPKSSADELLSKLQQREEKRSRRPIQLYRTGYDKELHRLIHDETIKTIEARIARYEFREARRMRCLPGGELIDLKGLTREESHRAIIESEINTLKKMRVMSRKINRAADLFAGISEPIEYFTELRERDPETIDPILTGLAKRPERRAKARQAIERILLQRRGEDHP